MTTAFPAARPRTGPDPDPAGASGAASTAGADPAFLLALYATVTRDDAFPALLDLLTARFGCVSAAIVYVDPNRPDADVAVATGRFDGAAQRRYREEFATLDPAPAAFARLPLGRATSTDLLFDTGDARHARFLHEFYFPLGLAGALGGPVAASDGRFGLVAVQRGPDRPPFGARDVAAFETLLPHLIQAVELRGAFFSLKAQAERLAGAADPLPTGLLVLSAEGRLLHANRAARAILDRRDALLLEPSGRVVGAGAAGAAEWSAALARAGRTGGPVVLRLPARNGLHAFYGARLAALPGRGRPEILLVLHDPGAAAPPAGAVLSAVLGLTPGGAALLEALLAGEDLKGYAAGAGLSVETARYHLKALFAATGTRRQADLVRLAGALTHDLASG